MTDKRQLAAVGFHSGELAVQRRAGAQAQAARLAPMVSRGELLSGLAAFLYDTTFAALTARDRTGRLWTSPLLGPPGLLHAASSTTLRIDTTLPAADPLHGLPDGQPVGLIAIDFTTRRRVRINGILASAGASGLAVDVEQAYGNCPQYIQQRRLHVDPRRADANRSPPFRGEVLRPEDIRLVQAADTFFLGTTHPDSGNDASHRGGPAGFVRVAPDHLWWPDYPGNNMFNSFGNLSVDPTAALLFVDFRRSATLQLSGTAAVRWGVPAADDDAHTGRRVEFAPQQVISTTVPTLDETDHPLPT
jgi:uncharacterized protein